MSVEEARVLWKVMINRINKIQKMTEQIENSTEVDLAKSEGIIIEAMKFGKISSNLLEIESFIREIEKQGRC